MGFGLGQGPCAPPPLGQSQGSGGVRRGVQAGLGANLLGCRKPEWQLDALLREGCLVRFYRDCVCRSAARKGPVGTGGNDGQRSGPGAGRGRGSLGAYGRRGSVWGGGALARSLGPG